jgi:cytochrome c oxidase subunit 4
MGHPNIAPRSYLLIYVLLLLLTLTTYGIATTAHLGAGEVPVALGIAAAKTVLVGLFFMHLIYSSRLTWLVIAAGVLFLAIMITLTLADYWTRDWMTYPRALTGPDSGRPFVTFHAGSGRTGCA